MKERKSLISFFKNTKFDFVGNLRYLLIAPFVLLLIGIVLFFTIGFNLGIDFTGGTIVNIALGDSLNNKAYENEAKADVQEVLSDFGLTASMFQITETSDSTIALAVRYQDKSSMSESEIETLNDEIADALREKFGFDTTELASKVETGQHIGATASGELLTNAFIAVLIGMVFILVYTIIRFEVTSGMAAILMLFHDILTMCVLTMIFRIQINSSFIAAIITILGYSINNTIVIFDRVRENIRNESYAKATNKEIANISVKETLSRTMLTTLTTMTAVILLAIIGVASVREFIIPIILGLIAGLYSSVFLAPGFWAMAFRRKKFKFKPSKKSNKKDNTVIDIQKDHGTDSIESSETVIG